jgi:hypothetical protein
VGTKQYTNLSDGIVGTKQYTNLSDGIVGTKQYTNLSDGIVGTKQYTNLSDGIVGMETTGMALRFSARILRALRILMRDLALASLLLLLLPGLSSSASMGVHSLLGDM